MATFDTTVPTTELEAVNTMLVAVGQAPLPSTTDLSTVNDADVVMALDILGKAAREVLSEGWKFNTRYGYEVPPSGQVLWVPPVVSSGVSSVFLNVFKKPPEFLAWNLTVCPENGDLDMVEGMSKQYREGGQSVMVLWDRTRNRDGADASRHETIFIDGIVAVQFEEMPESVRRYISTKAAREFAAKVVGSPDTVSYTIQDEMAALRLLKREQGNQTKPNFLTNSVSAWGWFGGRPYHASGAQRRVYRGGGG